MTLVLSEVQAMQNPALGSVLVWRFTCGYSPEGSADGAPLPLTFLVLPLVLHARTVAEITATQTGSGLRKLEEKFKDRSDLLHSVQSRVMAMRRLSLRSLRIALRAGLITLVPSGATAWPRTRSQAPGMSKPVTELAKASEKLGAWCASLTMFEVLKTLRVEL